MGQTHKKKKKIKESDNLNLIDEWDGMGVIQKDINQTAVLEKSKIGEYETIWKWEKSNRPFIHLKNMHWR